jgi:hypothetical protein
VEAVEAVGITTEEEGAAAGAEGAAAEHLFLYPMKNACRPVGEVRAAEPSRAKAATVGRAVAAATEAMAHPVVPVGVHPLPSRVNRRKVKALPRRAHSVMGETAVVGVTAAQAGAVLYWRPVDCFT